MGGTLFLIIWLLSGGLATYWAQKDPRIVGYKIPIMMWPLTVCFGPPALLVNLMYIAGWFGYED